LGQKDKFSEPIYPVCFVLAVDQEVDQIRGRSTGPVDLCAQECACSQLLRPDDRTVERL